MKKAIILKGLILMIFLSATSCDKDERVEATLPGEWTEVEPVMDRTLLIFSSDNRLKRIDGEGNEEDYRYTIEGESIFLSLASGLEGSTELYFKKLDPGRFLIGNLYVSIPENDPIYMTFERQ